MRHPVVHAAHWQQCQHRRSLSRAMIWDRALDAALVDALWHTPTGLIESGEPLQVKERCHVARLDGAQGPLVLKHHNWGGPWKTFCKSLRTPQARQGFLDGLYLAEHGVRTPQPMAVMERKLGALGVSSYLLTEFVPGTNLYRLMRFERPSAELIDHLAEQVAELCSRLDQLQVSHNDLKAENLMVDPAGRVWLIDLEKMRRHTHSGHVRERLLEDVNRLLHPRNWRESCEAAERFRERLAREPAVAAAVAHVQPQKHPLVQPHLLTRGHEEKLTAVVTTVEDAGNLRACLESLRDIADEIVLADNRLDNASLELARKYGCQLVHRMTETVVEHRNRALEAVQHPWVMVVEGDEQVSPDLAKELQCLLADGPKADGYRIERRRMYLGHVSKYGVFRGESPLRLFRRGLGRFVIQRTAPRIKLPREKSIGRLNAKLVYYLCWRLDEHLQSINDYTSQLASLRFEQGQRPRFIPALFRATRRFLRNYFWRYAWLDGRVGLQMSMLSAFSVWLCEAKLWERHHAKPQPRSASDEAQPQLKLFDPRAGDSVEVALNERKAA